MIDLRFVAPDLRRLDETSAEIIACGVWSDQRPFGGLAGLLDWRMAGRLSRLAREGFIDGAIGEVLVIPVRPRLPFDKLLAIGLGPKDAFDEDTFRRVLARARDAIAGLRVKKALVELFGRGAAVTAERAAEIFLDTLGDEEGDGVILVEDAEIGRRLEQHALERRRGAGLRARAADDA